MRKNYIITTPKVRFENKIEMIPFHECWEWTGGKYTNGYGVFHPSGTSSVSAHRYSYLIYKGDICNNLLVCHSCDNPGCVNPNHLFLGTQSDNMKDMIKKNRGNFPRITGEQCHKAKLNKEKVKEIRKRFLEENITQVELAKQYNVSKGNIGYIINNKSWRHI
jgi:hypothetical protein